MEKREEEKEQSERELEKRMFETDVVVTMERGASFATKRQPMDNSCDALMRACGLRGLDFRPSSHGSPVIFIYDIYRCSIDNPRAWNFFFLPLFTGKGLANERNRYTIVRFCARKKGAWKEGTLVTRWSPNDTCPTYFTRTVTVTERANFETISGSKVGYLLGEVPLPRSYVVPLLPRRASHCSLVSLTVRKFFLKILLSSVVYRWKFIRGE